MKNKLSSKMGSIFGLSFVLCSIFAFAAMADEVRYVYDDLGRLHQVMDEAGNAATYEYDEVAGSRRVRSFVLIFCRTVI